MLSAAHSARAPRMFRVADAVSDCEWQYSLWL